MALVTYNVQPATATPSNESWVYDPILGALPGLVFAKLSDSCCQRLLDFARWPDGWDGADSLAIAVPTLINLKTFLEAVRIPTVRRPSLFLTRSGFLQIMVRDSVGKRVDVILSPTGAEYCYEASAEEGSVPADTISTLAERFSRAVSN